MRLKANTGLFFVAILLLLTTLMPNWHLVLAESSCDASLEGKTDAELQALLDACEQEIADHNNQLKEVQKTANTLESGIQVLNVKISTSDSIIKAKNIKISQLKKEIARRSQEIDQLSASMEEVKKSLGNLVQETNELDRKSVVEAMLSSDNLSQFFDDLDSFSVLKGELNDQLKRIRDIKDQTKKAQDSLVVTRSSEEQEKFLKEKEKQQTEAYKGEQQRILKEVKVAEKNYKTVIAEKEAKKRAILSRMLNIGGNEIAFGDALKLIQPYEAKIGIDSAFALAVLVQESGVNGVIGSNLGKCHYNDSWNNSAGTVMSDNQKTAFLTIMTELGMDPDKAPVSCPISKDGQFGGAMGPSQFMPNTWMGYRERVASLVGVSYASPFVNEHAFVGTMLYLAEAKSRCQASFSSTFTLDACVAAKYYSGLATSGARLSKYMNPTSSYGYRVAKRAEQFAEDIKFLSL